MFIRKRTLVVLCLITSFIVAGFPLTTSHADTFRPVVRGKRGVVAGGSPLSVEAGLRIMQRGGNAVDAGVATSLAASVIEFSHFSFGGEVPILIKPKGEKVVVIEGMGQAPMKATREFFANRDGADSGGGPTMGTKKAGPDPLDWTTCSHSPRDSRCLRHRSRPVRHENSRGSHGARDSTRGRISD